MPIPTRSFSVRESRQTGPNVTAAATATGNGDGLNRKRTLLPQRGPRDDASSTPSMRQTQESRLPQRGSYNTTSGSGVGTATHRRGLSQQDDEKRPRSQGSATATSSSSSASTTASTAAGRRQSLIRPSPLKTVSSRSTSTTAAATSTIATPTKSTTTPTSPRKQPTRPQQNARPTSPKKTDMPPPPLPRHGRSASLRQPSSTLLSSPGAPAVGVRGHTRHHSQILTSTSTSGDNKAAKKVETPATPATPRSKATTYQQRFSPKKTVNSATTTTTTTTTAAAAAAAATGEHDPSLIPSSWPEIATLQTEVLQLHLFHSSSLQQHAEWQASSEAQLQKKYDSVAQKYRAIVNEEKQQQRNLNGQALRIWLQNIQVHNGHLGFAQQTQLLSQVVQEVTDLTDDMGNGVGGRYTQSIQAFETWFQKADQIRKCRTQLDQDAAADLVVFIDPLDRVWREELDALVLKLELCDRQLQSLDILGYGGGSTVEDSSVLIRTAKALDEMVHLMLDEVVSIRKIEHDIIRAERCWVSRLTGQLTASIDTQRSREERGLRTGIWRSALKG